MYLLRDIQHLKVLTESFLVSPNPEAVVENHVNLVKLKKPLGLVDNLVLIEQNNELKNNVRQCKRRGSRAAKGSRL